MSTHKEVKVGDTFKPSASMHNDLVRILNRLDGPKSVAGSKNSNGVTVLKVFNPTEQDFAAGTPVNFDNDTQMVADSVPIKTYEDKEAPWGVLLQPLQANSFGSCIVSGPVKVEIENSVGKYAVPMEDGFTATDKPDGNSALILFINNDGSAVICLGAGAPAEVVEEKKEEDCYVCRVIKAPSEEGYGENLKTNTLEALTAEVILGEKKGTVLQVFATTLCEGYIPYPKAGAIILVHRVASRAIEINDLSNAESYPQQ